jgi:rhodanese-related sulfurtransferase
LQLSDRDSYFVTGRPGADQRRSRFQTAAGHERLIVGGSILAKLAFAIRDPNNRHGRRKSLGRHRCDRFRFGKADLNLEREQCMTTSVKQMMDAANAAVPRITPVQAREMMTKGNTLVVDVRDAPEVDKSGKVAGSVNISRGMLEFRADPDSPYHDKSFSKDKTIILYCASGGRSALAGKALKDMGYDRVYNLGAFKDWAESGGALG